MTRRLLALYLIATTASATGCAPLLCPPGPGDSHSCTTTTYPDGHSTTTVHGYPPDNRDDHHAETAIVIGLGAVIATAVLVVLARRSGENRGETSSTPPPPTARVTSFDRAAALEPAAMIGPPGVAEVAAPTVASVEYVLPPTTDLDERRRQRMFVQGHMAARAGRCEATRAIANQLARTNTSFHALYVADPTIATCFR